MDAELEKEPEDMDIELVKMCAAVLADKLNPLTDKEPSPEKTMVFSENTPAQEAPTSTKRKVKFGKIMLIAAIIVLLCAVAIPAGARFMPSEAADKIIDFCYDHFKINLRSDEPKVTSSEKNDDLVNNLILENFESFKLPALIMTDNYTKDVNVQKDDYITTVMIDINNPVNNIQGTVAVTQYNDTNVELHNGVGNVSGMYKYFEQITINRTDVLVFGNDGEIYIKYIVDDTEYEITLNTDFDTAVSIAESIN